MVVFAPSIHTPRLSKVPVSVSRKVGCVLTSYEVHLFFYLITSLYRCCITFKPFETPICNGKQNNLKGPEITGSFKKRAPFRDGSRRLTRLARRIHKNTKTLLKSSIITQTSYNILIYNALITLCIYFTITWNTVRLFSRIHYLSTSS